MMPVAPLLPANLDVLNCSLDGISLIEASAGTGKTWTICGLYLRLLLERSLSVQQILVVTFTNAATAELRERIRARLVEMLACLSTQGEVDPFITQLASVVIERAGGDGKAVIDRLELALQCFDKASIFTIHGFCQHALADTPFSAGMPMRTELLESDRELVMQVVNDFWRRHVAGDSMTPELANYLIGRNDSPGKYAELFQRHLAKPLAQPLWPLDIDAPSMDTAELVPLYQQLVS